jgi:hypothetical protein
MPSPLVKQLAERNIHVFLEAYGITNDSGEKLDFKEHPYLWDIYEDWSPRQAILKAAQIGMSTTVNIKALWLAKNKGLDIIYSLPSSADIKDFVSGKTNRLIANNPIFQEWCEDKDSIEQKRVGSHVIYFKGTWTERAAIATPADLYISDETDRSKQDIVTQFKTRLQHSKFGWEWYFSNPSAPGNGVDKHWEESDQKHWFVKCECGHEWYLTMENIMYEGTKPYFGCLKCHKELNRRNGRWIAKHKGREVSGWWIPLLIVPNKSAEYILKKKEELSEEQFTNYVLGQPYVGRGNKLTRQMFLQNLVDTVNPRDTQMIIGVDTGIGINFELMNKYGTFFYDKVSSYEPLRKLMRDNPTAIMVIDQGGDIIGPRQLREEFPNRVFLCFFRADQKNDKLITWNDDEGTVVADRNKLIQLCVDEMADKRAPFYGTEADWNEYMLEWLGMYRTQEENQLGIPVFKWNKPSTGRCDYPFAHVYARIGMDRFMDSSASFHEAKAGLLFGTQGYEENPDHTTRL